MSGTQQVGLVQVAPLIGRIVLAAFIQALTYPFRSVRSTALYNDVLYAALRCMLRNITIAQSRYINPDTSAAYVAYCKSHQITPETLYVETRHGKKVAAHWLGSPDADTVIVHCHGGGYTQPANAGISRYLANLIKDLNGNDGSQSISVLILAYTLAPEATHPTQLQEVAAVLTHLINQSGRSPSSIFVSGDSAGGNLALALLSHLLHPHPDVPTIRLEQPLRGAILYSPWTGFSTDYASFNNFKLDMMSPVALRKWSAMFLGKSNPVNPEADPGPVSGDAYTEASMNPASWWNGLHAVVDSIFVSYGSYEVLADPIRELETQLKKGWGDGGGDSSQVVFIQGAKEAHVAPFVDFMSPVAKGKSSTQNAVEEWYKVRLQ